MSNINNNNTSENKISVDELLRKRKARNEGNKKIVRNNFQKRNEAVAKLHEQDEENLLLGEAQNDLQLRLLDAEDRAYVNFNDKYMSMTAKVLEDMDAKSEARALEINSAVDVEYQLIEEIKDEDFLLPPTRNRFSNVLFGEIEGAEEIKSLPGISGTKPEDNEFQF